MGTPEVQAVPSRCHSSFDCKFEAIMPNSRYRWSVHRAKFRLYHTGSFVALWLKIARAGPYFESQNPRAAQRASSSAAWCWQWRSTAFDGAEVRKRGGKVPVGARTSKVPRNSGPCIRAMILGTLEVQEEPSFQELSLRGGAHSASAPSSEALASLTVTKSADLPETRASLQCTRCTRPRLSKC